MSSTLFPPDDRPTWGGLAVIDWSARIHDLRGPRHQWAIEVAHALDAGDEPPPFPSGSDHTKATRMETALRIYREANGDAG